MKSLIALSLMLVLGTAQISHAEKNCDNADLKNDWSVTVQKLSLGEATWNQVLRARYTFIFNDATCPGLSLEDFCAEGLGLGDILEAQAKVEYDHGRTTQSDWIGISFMNNAAHSQCKTAKK